MELMYGYVYFIHNNAVLMSKYYETDTSSVLLIPWSRILEKLIVSHPIMKYPLLYGRFSNEFSRARHRPYSDPDESLI
jgi:hypothetical protein